MTIFHSLRGASKRSVIGIFCVFFVLTANKAIAETALDGIPAGAYGVDLSHASIVWKVSHLGFSTYVGRFTDFSADLNLDVDDFSKSSVKVDIKVDSIATAYPWVDKEDFDTVLAEDWFKSEEYPSITFSSKSVSGLVDGKAKVVGDMTMLGQTHEVVLDINLNKATANHPFKKVPVIGFSATTAIDRTIWGLSKYAPNIGASVVIEIEGEFIQLVTCKDGVHCQVRCWVTILHLDMVIRQKPIVVIIGTSTHRRTNCIWRSWSSKGIFSR